MKTLVELTMKDVKEIANKVTMGGCSEVARTPLEMALAKKCEKLYDSLVTANNERNRLFGLLYGHYIRLGDLKKVFDEKRANELLKESVRLVQRSAKMHSEAADMNYTFEEQTP